MLLRGGSVLDVHSATWRRADLVLAAGRVAAVLPGPELVDLPARQSWRLHGPSDYPRQLSFSPDGSLLAVSGGSSRRVLLWDTARGVLHRTLEREGPTLALFSPTGDALALVALNGDVHLCTPPEAEPRLVAQARLVAAERSTRTIQALRDSRGHGSCAS